MCSAMMQTSKLLIKGYKGGSPHVAMQGYWGKKNNFSGVFFEDKVVYAGFKRTMTRIDDGGSVVRRSNVLECLEDVKLTYRGVLRALYSGKYRTVGP